MKKSGFTLLETLLIMAIFIVFTAMGVSLYQRQSARSKINQTVLQIQQLSYATKAFYRHNHCWPGSENCSGDLSAYAPAGIITNPWGNSYILQVAPQNKKIFEVIASRVPIEFAQKIAKALPLATTQHCDGLGCDVAAQIAAPE